MSEEQPTGEGVGLDAAYALETPDDAVDLYRRWASTYDSEFIDATGYVYGINVARLLADRLDTGATVLDVGCGTGVVGTALAGLGSWTVDGLDLSEEMLEQAAEKTDDDGLVVYRRLVQADLTVGVDLPDASYSGVISAGTFTHGHVGPQAIAELVRLGAPGAVFVLGVNREFFEAADFEGELDSLRGEGLIDSFDLVDIPIYSNPDFEHVDAVARAVVFARPR